MNKGILLHFDHVRVVRWNKDRTCPKTQYGSGPVRRPGSGEIRNVGDKNHSTIMYSGCRLKPEIAQNNMNLLLVVMFSKLSGSLVICGLFKTQLYLFRFLILHSNQDFNISSILAISYESYDMTHISLQFQAVSSIRKQFQAVESLNLEMCVF